MTRSWVRVLWWVCCLGFIGAAVFGGRLEDETGLPVGPTSLLLLLIFAVYRAVDWYVFRVEHPPDAQSEDEASEPQTVEMAVQRVEARRSRTAESMRTAAEPRDP